MQFEIPASSARDEADRADHRMPSTDGAPEFEWSALPASLLAKLAKHTGTARRGATPDIVLREHFGSPPGDDFVQQAWPVLRDAWLARHPGPRIAVVDRLRSAGLGDADGAMRTPAAQVAYLKSCRNTARLRRIVLEQVLEAGASHARDPAVPRPDAAQGAGSGSLTPEILRDHLARLGVGQQIRIVDGSGRVLAAFDALPNGTIEATLLGRDGPGRRVEPASRADLTGLVHEASTFLGAIGTTSLTLVDAAGIERGLGGDAQPPAVTEDGILDRSGVPLSEQVGRFLSQRLGVSFSDLRRDVDGDIPFRVGSATFFVRAIDDPPIIIVFSPLLLDVDPSPALSRTLSQWSGHGLLRFREYDRVVTAEIVLPGEPFIGQHLDIAVGTMAAVLDDADDRLQESFGGRRASDDHGKPAPRTGVMAEGGYL